MEIKEFQQQSKRTMPKVGDRYKVGDSEYAHTPHTIVANYSMGLAGEAGEVTDLLKKVVFHGHPLDRDKVKKELGDVMHYVAGLASLLDIDMEEVLEDNIEKLKKRFPNGFNSEDSIQRVDTKVTKRH